MNLGHQVTTCLLRLGNSVEAAVVRVCHPSNSEREVIGSELRTTQGRGTGRSLVP